MPFTAWKDQERNRHKVVRNNSFIVSKYNFFRADLVTILKALYRTFDCSGYKLKFVVRPAGQLWLDGHLLHIAVKSTYRT